MRRRINILLYTLIAVCLAGQLLIFCGLLEIAGMFAIVAILIVIAILYLYSN